jgi:hypothetical protein
MSANGGFPGFLTSLSVTDEASFLWWFISQLNNRQCTAELVKVVAVHGEGGPTNPPPTVDVQPMVHQVDPLGVITPHGVIPGVPSFRLQAGGAAVVMDPKEGDVGLCIFAARDISKVKNTGEPAPPGSQRRFDWADGLYLGAFLGSAPSRYLWFSDSGVQVVDPVKITVQAPEVDVTSTTKVVVSAPEVDLGGTGGAGVARIGDAVSGGVITGGSSKVKAT